MGSDKIPFIYYVHPVIVCALSYVLVREIHRWTSVSIYIRISSSKKKICVDRLKLFYLIFGKKELNSWRV